MELLKEIKEKFSSGGFGSNWHKLDCLSPGYDAYTFKEYKIGYGVAIPYKYKEELVLKFNNCKFFTHKLVLENDETIDLLCLGSFNVDIENEFATFCAQFVEPGENGENRKKVLENPSKWAENWSKLMGNTISSKKAYDVLAELIVYYHLLLEGIDVTWTAAINGTNDLESEKESFEVKSTISRYNNSITVSSEFQLNPLKKLYLYFCKFEESPIGVSINDMVSLLKKKGIEDTILEERLIKLNLEKGVKARNVKYKMIENRCYEVDDNFPRITSNSFVGGQKPLGIGHIVYDLDLDVIKNYTTWMDALV